MKNSIITFGLDSVKGVGMPELKELFEKVLKEKIPIYIWGGCAEARGVSESDLEGKNAKIVNPKIASDLVVSNDWVVTFNFLKMSQFGVQSGAEKFSNLCSCRAKLSC